MGPVRANETRSHSWFPRKRSPVGRAPASVAAPAFHPYGAHVTLAAVDASGFWTIAFPLIVFGVGLALGYRMFLRARKLVLRERRRGDELIQDAKALRAQVLALRLAAEGKPARGPLVFRAKQGEDLFLFELFNPAGSPLKTSGVAIECGAHDGRSGSVTALLDAIGWDCVLVEPLPHLAAECRENRPHARVVHSALSKRGSSGTAVIRQVRGNSGRSFLAEQAHGANQTSKDAVEIEVPLTTMDAVLGDAVTAVDVLVLDVEGAELSVLDGFDLDRYQPRVMLIEDHELGEGGGLHAAVTARGYVHAGWVWRNRVFIRKDDRELLDRALDIQQQYHQLKRTPG